MSKLRGVLSKTSTPPEFHSEAPATSGLPVATFHPKDILDLKLHSAVPKPLPLRGLYHSEVLHLKALSAPKPSPFWRLQLRTWSSNKRSSLIFAETYATPFSHTFITCYVLISAGSYEQWQILRHAILTDQHQWSWSLQQIQHMQIVQLQQSANSASTSVSMSGIYNPSTPRRKEVAFTIPKAHLPLHWKSLYSSPPPH